jgi:hypothetical protein
MVIFIVKSTRSTETVTMSIPLSTSLVANVLC